MDNSNVFTRMNHQVLRRSRQWVKTGHVFAPISGRLGKSKKPGPRKVESGHHVGKLEDVGLLARAAQRREGEIGQGAGRCKRLSEEGIDLFL